MALEIEGITQQYDLEIASAGIDPEILLAAVEKITEGRANGGVRSISRAIEKKIADGLVDAKLEGATHVRFAAEGELILCHPGAERAVADRYPDACPAGGIRCARITAESGGLSYPSDCR